MVKSVSSCFTLYCGALDLPAEVGAVLSWRTWGIVPECGHRQWHSPMLHLTLLQSPLPSARLGADGNRAELQVSLLHFSEVHLNHGLLLRIRHVALR